MNLYKAYAIYEKLNRKIKPGAAPEIIKDIYIELHKSFLEDLEKKTISLDENRKRTYIEKIVELYNSHNQNDSRWRDICAIEKSIEDELSQDAALYEETIRVKESQQSAT